MKTLRKRRNPDPIEHIRGKLGYARFEKDKSRNRFESWFSKKKSKKTKNSTSRGLKLT